MLVARLLLRSISPFFPQGCSVMLGSRPIQDRAATITRPGPRERMKGAGSLSGERRRFMRLDPVMQVLDGDAGGATDVDDGQFTRAH